VRADQASLTLVVAGSLQEFERMITAIVKDLTLDCSRLQGEAIIGGRKYVYCRGAEALRGLEPDRVIWYGTFRDRLDLDQIKAEVAAQVG
jgi:hypothetical protein